LILADARLDGHAATALATHFGDVGRVVSASSSDLQQAGVSKRVADKIVEPNLERVDAALAWATAAGHHLVRIGTDLFPELLTRITDPPVLLFVNGDPDVLHLPTLAIVGSRNPTTGGIQNAHDFANHLGQAGFAIASGLAQGIDTAAHTGALHGNARTVAFLGHGIDRVYPAANRDLAHQIAESGALVSEYPLGAPPRKEHFPERNRLISGCSMGTLVVEAARRSGSLITARLSSEQGREVFAIPGSIHNALSRGCHSLIRQGAKLVESADDIVSELGPMVSHLTTLAKLDGSENGADEQLMQNDPAPESPSSLRSNLDDEYKLLIKMMAHDPATVDEIARKSRLTIDQVSSMLLILELEGEVEALNGGQYALLRRRSGHERKRTRRTDVPV
jgi:DNA processing protein